MYHVCRVRLPVVHGGTSGLLIAQYRPHLGLPPEIPEYQVTSGNRADNTKRYELPSTQGLMTSVNREGLVLLSWAGEEPGREPVHDDGGDSSVADHRRAVRILIDSIEATSSPRSVIDHSHVKLLKHIDADALPPILLQRGTMKLVDGLHRLHAAKLRGDDTILAEYFDGDDDAAFMMAVKVNSQHGLPLTLRDRKQAARKVLMRHPDWSDRSIASAVGLSNKTVSRLRSEFGSSIPAVQRRVGMDGVAQPVNHIEGRARAEAVLDRDPGATATEIANRAGVSLTTAKVVRSRWKDRASGSRSSSTPDGENIPGTAPSCRDKEDPSAQYYKHALRRLSSDPSIRLSQHGRTLFRLLEPGARAEGDWEDLASNIPQHCRVIVAEMAQLQVRNWARFAAIIADRNEKAS